MVKYDPNKHHRRSIRLPGYDYSSPGAYFITICTQKQKCILGEISNGVMYLNEFGQIVANEWMKSCQIRCEIKLDEWIVMPNHIHGIAWIQATSNNKAQYTSSQQKIERLQKLQNSILFMKPKSISSFISGFKSAATKQINIARNTPGFPVWQRNYYEHIIRDESSLQTIRQYIRNNPLSWELDSLHPSSPPRRNLLG